MKSFHCKLYVWILCGLPLLFSRETSLADEPAVTKVALVTASTSALVSMPTSEKLSIASFILALAVAIVNWVYLHLKHKAVSDDMARRKKLYDLHIVPPGLEDHPIVTNKPVKEQNERSQPSPN